MRPLRANHIVGHSLRIRARNRGRVTPVTECSPDCYCWPRGDAVRLPCRSGPVPASDGFGRKRTLSSRKPIDLAERRTHRRYPAWLEAALHDREASVLVPVTVVDISAGGALVQSPHPLADGSDVTLSLTTPAGALELDGHAVRTEDSWVGPQVHLGFELVDPATRLQLLRLLDELQSAFTHGQTELARRRIR